MTQTRNIERKQGKSAIAVYSCSLQEERLINEYGRTHAIQMFTTDEPLTQDNINLTEGCRCISVNHTSLINNLLLDELSKWGIKYISTRSIGYDHIDIEYAKQIGISVGNIGYSKSSVAEYTIMLMLMAIRRIKTVLEKTKIQDFTMPDQAAGELGSLTAGVIGTGIIGETVISYLKGFGCRILACDPFEKESVKRMATYTSLENLLAQSDIVTLHVPASVKNYHLINRENLNKIKHNSILINTSRGTLVDTEALIEALEEERISGAALDVVEHENGVFYEDYKKRILPNKELALLNTFPNVIITPHIAFHTEQAVHDMVESSLNHCKAFEEGQLAVPVSRA